MTWQQSIRRLGKAALANLLYGSGVLAGLRRRRARRGETVVLAFHRVAGAADAPLPLALPPEFFRAIVAGVARRYTIASWQDCVAVARGSARRARVVFTFDDGYRDQAEVAWPILKAAQAAAIFFVSTAAVDGSEPFWWDVVALRHRPPHGPRFPLVGPGEAAFGGVAMEEIARCKWLPDIERRERVTRWRAELGEVAAEMPPPMSWEAVRRLATEGAELGGHGVTHAMLTHCEDADLLAELQGCRDAIARELGRPPDLFAYPNGTYDERVVRTVQRVGFRWAFTTEPGSFTDASDPLRVPRIAVSPAHCGWNGKRFSWPLFEAELLGVFELLRGRRGDDAK